MRSENVYRAVEHGRSRYEICQVVSKSARRLHKPGACFQDTIDYSLLHMTRPAEVPTVVPAKSAVRRAKAA